MKILIASNIRQHPAILREFLEGLDRLEKPCECSYYFVTQLEGEAEDVLRKWCEDKDSVKVEEVAKDTPVYVVDEETHRWTIELVDLMMELRNRCLKEALEGGYDYLLELDSDTILYPKTLVQLLSREKDIITEIHWTRWFPKDSEIPNVWFFDNYGFYKDSLERLRKEELLEIGGFGGIALISQKALEEGVSYSRLPNLNPNWGEQRHFCVRAMSLGFKLWVDTVYPAFHIYRLSDLKILKIWKGNGFKASRTDEVLTSGVPKVLVAVPHTGVLRFELVSYLLNLVNRCARNNGIRLSVDLSYGMPVDSNRNSIVKKFLATDNKWLLIIDSDIEPPVNVLEELLNHNEKVVGAVCWSNMGGEKGERWERFGIPYPVIMKKDLKGGWKVDKERITTSREKLVECDAASCACVLLYREVLEAITPPWFKLLYDENGICNAGEDFTFFDKVKSKGYKVFVDKRLQCEHYKTVGIKLFNELLAETESVKSE